MELQPQVIKQLREQALFASSIPTTEGQMWFQDLSGQLQKTHDLVGVVKGLTTEDAMSLMKTVTTTPAEHGGCIQIICVCYTKISLSWPMLKMPR